jgi:hypothetical protein
MMQPRSSLTLAALAFACSGVAILAGILAPSWGHLYQFSYTTVQTPRILYPMPLRRVAADEFAAITEHPLFNTDRKKDPPAASTAAASQLPSIQEYRLAGVIVMKDAALALVERKATKTVVTLKVGDSLDGRIVTDISPAGVQLASSSQVETLSIPKVQGASFVSNTEPEKTKAP